MLLNCYIKNFERREVFFSLSDFTICQLTTALERRKGFFNYLVFRLSTLNLTVRYAKAVFPLACAGRTKSCKHVWVRSPMAIFPPFSIVQIRWSGKQAIGVRVGETSTKQQRIFAHVNVSVMLFLAESGKAKTCW